MLIVLLILFAIIETAFLISELRSPSSRRELAEWWSKQTGLRRFLWIAAGLYGWNLAVAMLVLYGRLGQADLTCSGGRAEIGSTLTDDSNDVIVARAALRATTILGGAYILGYEYRTSSGGRYVRLNSLTTYGENGAFGSLNHTLTILGGLVAYDFVGVVYDASNITLLPCDANVYDPAIDKR